MPQGNQSLLQILPQVDKDTVATNWATAYGLPFRSEGIKGNVTKYGSKALRRNSQRDKSLVRSGTVSATGPINLEATNVSLHTVLPLFFNGPAAELAPVAGAYNRIYVPKIGPATYATVKINDSEVSRIHRGSVITELNLSAEVDDLVILDTTWGAVDLTPVNETNPGSAALPNEYGLYFEEGVVKIGDDVASLAPAFAKNFSLAITRNAKLDRFGLGSRFMRDIPVGVYDITGSVTLDANSLDPADKAALFKAAMDTKMISLQLTFVDTVNLVGGQPSRFVVTVPFATIDWPEHNISSEDFIEGAVNFTSYAVTSPAAVVADTIPTDQFSIHHVYQLGS